MRGYGQRDVERRRVEYRQYYGGGGRESADDVAGNRGRLHPRVQLQRQYPDQEEQGEDPARQQRALHHVRAFFPVLLIFSW